MAGRAFGSDSEYGYDLTGSDEELLLAIADRLSPASPQQRPAPATPATPAPRSKASTLARTAVASTPYSPDLNSHAILAVDETLAAIGDDDLSFDISELDDAAFDRGQRPEQSPAQEQVRHISRASTVERHSRRLAPSVSGSHDGLSSFVSKTKPRHIATLLPGPDVRYPDCTWFPLSVHRK